MVQRIRTNRLNATLLVVLGSCLVFQHYARAQTTPLTTRVVGSGFSNPLYVTAPPGDNTRVFVVEQRGNPTSTSARVMIIDLTTSPPTTLGTPFLTLTGVSTANEQGLLGMAFSPDYATSGRFYLSYTNPNTQIVRGTVSANPNIANTTFTSILTITQPFSNHNGGWIGFGPDGYLYIGMGDGGSEYDPQHNGQKTSTLLSKMLRIDVSGAGSGYTVPPDNPWVGIAGRVPEAWLWGLRNPWRNAFDRLNGDLYMGDVGQDNYEEIDIAPAGVSNLNYGWSCMEANHCCTTCSTPSGCTCSVGCPNGSGLTCPVAEYAHGAACSVTGGYVYRGAKIPDWQGQYWFADYCSAHFFTMPAGGGAVTDRTSLMVPTLPSPGAALTSITSFGEDASGEIYIVSRGGRVARIEVNCAGAAKNFDTQPSSQTVCQGATVAFSVSVSGIRGAVSYDWRKNGVSLGGHVGATLTLTNVGPGNAGSYDVVVTDQCGGTTSSAATLTVNSSPSASLGVSAQASPICSGGSTNIQVANSESGVNYQLRNNADNSNVGSPVSGNGGTISLPTGNLTSATTFNVLASIAGCTDVQLTQTAQVTVNVPGPGDEDADCAVTEADIPIFVDVLLGNDTDPGHVARADVNGDTLANGDDIGPFTLLLAP